MSIPVRRAIRERQALLQDAPLHYNGERLMPGTAEHKRVAKRLAETSSTDEIKALLGRAT